MIGPLVSMAFGMHPISTIKPGCRISLVNELHQQLAGHIKIIHGAADFDEAVGRICFPGLH